MDAAETVHPCAEPGVVLSKDGTTSGMLEELDGEVGDRADRGHLWNPLVLCRTVACWGVDGYCYDMLR